MTDSLYIQPPTDEERRPTVPDRFYRSVGGAARRALFWLLGQDKDAWVRYGNEIRDGGDTDMSYPLEISPDALETLPGPFIPPRD